MRIPRIYFPHDCKIGEIIVLNSNATHYIIHVLRMKENNIVELFNGNNIIYKTKIINLNKHSKVKLIILYKTYKSIESSLKLHLGQVLLSSKKMEFIIQKAVELGVNTVTPIIPIRNYNTSKLNLLDTKIKRWRDIINNSCAQCGRNKIMKIETPKSILDWCTILKKNIKIYFNPYSNNNIYKLKKLLLINKIYFLIGSESGLSKEDDLIINNYKFFNISLGPRILRVETAVISATTILQTVFGDMGN